MKGNLPILIIEDQAELQECIRCAILHNQIKNPVLYAANRSEAFDYLSSIQYQAARVQNKLPGVIILNYHLEGDSSLQILASIKADHIYNQIPVIIFGETNSEEDMDACYALGCNGYFRIPQSEDEFNKIIKVIYDFWLHAAAIPYFAERV